MNILISPNTGIRAFVYMFAPNNDCDGCLRLGARRKIDSDIKMIFSIVFSMVAIFALEQLTFVRVIRKGN